MPIRNKGGLCVMAVKTMPNYCPRGSVLLVEDDPSYCQLLRESFDEAGFRTLQADNGAKALQLLREEQVDLVVADFIMPELNGLELCRLLSSDYRLASLKVVLYSSNTDVLFRKKAREFGALDYLPKAANTAELVDQICKLARLDKGREPEPPVKATSRKEEIQHTLFQSFGQLEILVENQLNLLQIASLSGPLPDATRLALESALQAGREIKSLLNETEKSSQDLVAVAKSA
ncbi:MAG: response regulator [Acidobacteria bacterium]|nr:response regulator [Acidobacteriota bacterium]